MERGEEKALNDIEQYGCHVISVLAEQELPPFSYSVGIHRTSEVPEILVIGLKQPIAHFIVNEYNSRIRAGERFEAGQYYSGFVEGFECQLRAVHSSHFFKYLGWCRWLYDGNNFTVLQLVYPTTAGVWPWYETAPQSFREWQPLLDQPS